ncbi:glycoside hydrolase [Trametopsis cervina]|nr:glycoside hydrolase [Trametopsis cervina]
MLRHTLAHPIIILTLALISICAAAQQHPHRRAVSSTAKAGLAWPNGPYADIDQFTTTGKVQWYYTWSPSGFPSTLEFVPMLWGPSQLSSWTANINHTISQLHISSVLGFNEPQEVSQSNISPTDAAALWAQHIEPLKAQGIRLGSPAPSSAPSGKTWLMQWLDACGAVGGCTVDFVALHWYDINSTAFIEYLQDFHDTFQRPIWVTEWACQNFNKADDQCSPQDIVNFMNATQEFMDNTEWVERYAWFGAFMDLQGVNQVRLHPLSFLHFLPSFPFSRALH